MALLCGIQCGNLYTFHVALSHMYKLYTQGKFIPEMSFCRAWLSAELLFQVLGAVSSSLSAKCCPSHPGRYIVPISVWNLFPVFVRLWVYVAETFTRCVRKSWGLNREKSGALSHIKELTTTWNRGQNLFALTGWLSQLNLQLSDIKY